MAAPHSWQDMTASAVPILFERVCSKCLFADTGKAGLFKFAVVAKSRAKEVKRIEMLLGFLQSRSLHHCRGLSLLLLLLLPVLLAGAAPFGQEPARSPTGQGRNPRKECAGRLPQHAQPCGVVRCKGSCAPALLVGAGAGGGDPKTQERGATTQ